MPFFEPLPPEPPESSRPPRKWAPPLWDREPEHILGIPVAVGQLVARTDLVALALTDVHAYPNGFSFDLLIATNPMRADPDGMPPYGRHHQFPPRIGFEFSDGQRVSGAGHTIPRDPQGLPTAPVLMQRGGGGSQDRFSWRHWCHPLPPPGPVTFYLEWNKLGIDECSIVFDGDAIIEASGRAITLWEPQ